MSFTVKLFKCEEESCDYHLQWTYLYSIKYFEKFKVEQL